MIALIRFLLPFTSFHLQVQPLLSDAIKRNVTPMTEWLTCYRRYSDADAV